MFQLSNHSHTSLLLTIHKLQNFILVWIILVREQKQGNWILFLKIPFKSYFCWKSLFVFYVAVVYSGLFFFFSIIAYAKSRPAELFHVVNSLLNPDCFAWVADFHIPHYEFGIFLIYVGSVPSKGCMTVDLYTYQSGFLSSTEENKRPDPVGE